MFVDNINVFYCRLSGVVKRLEKMFLVLYFMQLNIANSFDIETPFLDLELPITIAIAFPYNFDIREYFNFGLLISHFWIEMFLHPLLMVFIFRSLFVLRKYVQC